MKPSFAIYVTLLCLIISCTSYEDKKAQKFTLQGEINGQDSGIIMLSYYSAETRIIDSSKIRNGKFVFKGEIFEPTQARLKDRNDLNTVWIYLEPRNMKISLSKDKL